MGSEVYVVNGESFKLCSTSKQMILFFKELLEKKLQTFSNYDLNGIAWGLLPILEQLGYQVETFKMDNGEECVRIYNEKSSLCYHSYNRKAVTSIPLYQYKNKHLAKINELQLEIKRAQIELDRLTTDKVDLEVKLDDSNDGLFVSDFMLDEDFNDEILDFDLPDCSKEQLL